MKHFHLLLLIFVCFISKAQTYNITLQPQLDMSDTIVIDQTFGTWNFVRNNSTAPIDFIRFSWYISTDSIFDNSDLLINTWTTNPGDGLLSPGATASIGTVFAKVPESYAIGCSYFIIMRAEINSTYTETNYLDNFSFKKVCLRANRIDLSSSISTNKNIYYVGVDNTTTIADGRIVNIGELASGTYITYDIKLGSSPNPEEGNIYSVRKSVATLNSGASVSVSESFNISQLGAGTYFIFLDVDPDRAINDPIRSNNLGIGSFLITNLDTIKGGEAVLMPVGSEARYIATCDAKVYDDGGPTANYSPDTNGELHIFAAETDKRIRIKVNSYNFTSPDYMAIFRKSCLFCNHTTLNLFNSTSLPMEFVDMVPNSHIYLKQYSNSTGQSTGAEFEVSCAPAFEYRAEITNSTKPTYVIDKDLVNFNFNIRNRGFDNIASLKYTFGLASSESQDNILYESDVRTSPSITINNIASIEGNTFSLKEINNLSPGIYYIYVKTGIDNPDENLEDNIAYFPVNLTIAETVENISVNFQKNESLHFSTCNITLYDDGGPNGNYSNNFTGRVYLYPENPDMAIQLQLNYDLETAMSGPNFIFKDILSIWDVNNNKKMNLPFGGNYHYIARDLPEDALMLDFTSDEINVRSGFKITVGCAFKGLDVKNDAIKPSKDTLILNLDKHLSYTGKMSNNGTIVPPDEIKFKVYVSTSPDKSDAIFTSPDYSYRSLHNNQGYSNYNGQLDLSFITSIGKYYLISELDPTNTLNEVDKTNNIVVDSFYVKDLPEGEHRLPESDVYTVSDCDFKLYDYMGSTETSTFVDWGSRIIINPTNSTGKLKIRINSFTGNNWDLILEIYERSVHATTPVATYSRNTAGVEYEASTNGSPLEVRVSLRFLTSATTSFNLDADVTCDGLVTSLDNKNEAEKFSIYPIPATDKMQIRTSSVGKIIVYDVRGNMMVSKDISILDELDINSWANGIYFIHFTGFEFTTVRKVEKQ